MDLNFIVFPAPEKRQDNPDFFPVFYVEQNVESGCCFYRMKRVPNVFLPCEHLTDKFVIYFHGNAEDIFYCQEFVNQISKSLRAHCIAMEYPGYSIYNGKPSERVIQEDALALYHYLIACGVKSQNIIVLGRSMGSGPATFLASHEEVGALILLSAYESLGRVAKDMAGLLHIFVKERFKNYEEIKRVQCPALLIHGTKDNVIRVQHSENLFKLVPHERKELVLREGMTHNVLSLYEDVIRPMSNFLKEYGLGPVFQRQSQKQTESVLLVIERILSGPTKRTTAIKLARPLVPPH